ncbi:CIA30 family protein [Draconibacterium orientale]|uniref:CIA30 family protein n=1 Tax=Draconibacterium orientale TaxID=1168034 RepID=UPI002ABD7286|nr:CIA30 family protein [Draconibacterium orientale]
MLVLIVIAFLQMNTGVLYDFSKSASLEGWYIVNDGVMGGRSSSTFKLNKQGNAIFTGQVSLENNGGFSSVHYRFPALETTGYQFLALRVKGDGKRYQVRIKDRAGDTYSYIAYFTTSGEWQHIKVPLKDMYPSFRGRTLDLPNFSDGEIEEFALLIGNKKEETFRILIDKIEFLK